MSGVRMVGMGGRAGRASLAPAGRRVADPVDQGAGLTPGLLDSLLDALPVGVAVAEPGPRLLLANRVAQEYLATEGTAETDAQVWDFRRMFQAGTGSPFPRARNPLLRALEGETSYVDDLECADAAGSRHLLEAWGRPVRDEDGRLRLAVLVLSDVSAQRAVEESLEHDAQLLDLLQDAIIVQDVDGRVTYWNHGAEELYGWPSEEVLGREPDDLLATRYPQPVDQVLRTLAAEGSWEGELRQRARDGHEVTVASRWVARRDASASVAAVLTINTDVTLRKAAESVLASKTLELERSNAELASFAYVASHDLAEPLRSIAGPIGLMSKRLDGLLDDETLQLMDFVVDGCERMRALIDDLLALAKVGRSARGGHVLVDLQELFDRCGRLLRAETADSGAVIFCDQPLPVVLGEPSELYQLLQNLLANAMKFVVTGRRPEIHVKAEPEGALWRITVSDNGIGIPPSQREDVFRLFQRLHTREEFPGTGLGLALCQKVVQLHGGAIGVDGNDTGDGSSFWFTLPRLDAEGSDGRTQPYESPVEPERTAR